jgi:hypothetical protein
MHESKRGRGMSGEVEKLIVKHKKYTGIRNI